MTNQTSREDILVVETKSGLKTYVIQAFFVRTMQIRATDEASALDLAEAEGIMRTNDCSMNPLNWVATEVGE